MYLRFIITFVHRNCFLFTSTLTLVGSIICYLSLQKVGESNDSSVLYIGITSSPDHARERQSLRDTWLQLLPNSFRYKFLVGRDMCNIHPDDRISKYSCDKLQISIPKGITGNTLLYANVLNESNEGTEMGYGISFHVHHPIIIQCLGLKKNLLNTTNGRLVRVVLTDMVSSSKISSVTFYSHFEHEELDIKGYIFKKLINPVLLPKGFEGIIRVEGVEETFSEESCKALTHWNEGNLFSIYNIFTRNSREINNNYFCMLPTFGFTIKDLEQLKIHVEGIHNRTKEWHSYSTEIYNKVQIESAEYKDILVLNMTDVYRNLPQKMLLYFKWIFRNKNVKYVLKTDDDSFIDILKISKELEKPGEWDWWSCFRIGWPVHRHGKWQETAHTQEIYPPFPSGAGYVLSERALMWLTERLDNLSVNYQGEDVAMGIWLEGMNARRYDGEVCYWACNEQCHPLTCNVMQLSVQGMYNVWEEYQRCGSKICYCPEP